MDAQTHRPMACASSSRVPRDVHAVVIRTRCGSKQVPSRSIAQATLSRRSATERRARACRWPRARSAWYLSWLPGIALGGDAVPMVFVVSLCQIGLPLLKYGRDGHTLIFREAPEREDA